MMPELLRRLLGLKPETPGSEGTSAETPGGEQVDGEQVDAEQPQEAAWEAAVTESADFRDFAQAGIILDRARRIRIESAADRDRASR